MKKIILFSIAALFCLPAFCDELWSADFRFDGSEITDKPIVLRPTDDICYSTYLVPGEPQSLEITTEDTSDSGINALLFGDYMCVPVEGSVRWDYGSDTYKDFPLDDTYLLKETISTELGTQVLSRKVTLVPEPAVLLLIAFVGALFLRKRTKSLLALIAVVSLTSLSAQANCVSYIRGLQIWPFSRSVVITYGLQSENADAAFSVKFYGSVDQGETVFDLSEKGALLGDGAAGTVTGTGEHKIIWTPGEQFYFTKSNLRVKIVAEESTFSEGYAVIDLSGGPTAASYPVTYLDSVPEGGWTEEYKTTKLVLRKIDPGTFTMGSIESEVGRDVNETSHEVTLTNSYYIGVFETTQKQYELVMGDNPSYYHGDTRPVEMVSFDMLRGDTLGAKWPDSYEVDASSFFGKLRAKTGLTFDLPTEAQWEFACRAGTTSALNSGKDLTNEDECLNVDEVGRYHYDREDGKGGFSDAHTIVGCYKPNAWGLYDMHGNVNEWCLDQYQSDPGSEAIVEPLGASWSMHRTIKSGAWAAGSRRAGRCRSAARDFRSSDNASFYEGFRIALVMSPFVTPSEISKRVFQYKLIPSTESTMPVFQTTFYGKLKDGSEKLLEEMGKLEYDGASGIVIGRGYHDLTWIPDPEYVDQMDDVELRTEFEDVTNFADYLVLDTKTGKMRISANAPDISDDTCKTDELWLRRIEPGTFGMGGSEKKDVTLTKAFYIGIFEMTQKQCQNIAGGNPSSYTGPTRPVESVNYKMLRGTEKGAAFPANYDVDEDSFMGRLRKKAGNLFDLPTSAQWEYACRAGTTTDLNSGKDYTQSNANEVGRNLNNWDDGKGAYNMYHTDVGEYLVNNWGLYDMHGNVSEFCIDWVGSSEATVDPVGPDTGSGRVIRGGNHYDGGGVSYSSGGAYTYVYNFHLGFRIALLPE